jgi:hypothetical protein
MGLHREFRWIYECVINRILIMDNFVDGALSDGINASGGHCPGPKGHATASGE